MLLRSSALLFFTAVVPLVAQQQPARDETPTFTSDARLVVLHATVADSRGRLLNTLKRDAFTVLENGVQQTIKDVRREDVPISLGLIVDNSGSMRDKRPKVEAAALALVKASNSQDEVFIVNFNDEAYLDRAFTANVKDMEEGLTRIDSRGGTAMRDAVSMSIDYAKEKGKKDKKVILIITDGNDNTSNGTLERLLTKAQQSEMVVYAIGLLTEEDRREAKKAKRALDELTRASGGAAYYPKTLSEVEELALQVAQEIRNQYTITYTPVSPDDGTFRQIKVLARGPGNPVVRTRSGYYAGKPSQSKVSQVQPTQP